MIRIAAAALVLGFMGTVAMGPVAVAQSARDPDPIALPDENADPDSVVVNRSVERPIQLPDGDNRSARQRSRDRSRFDRCVMRVQGRDSDSPSANPVSIAPEEYCSSRLGMRDRNSVPDRKSKNQ